MSESEINKAYDARVNGLISNTALFCDNFAVFEKEFNRRCAKAGISPDISADALEVAYTASRTEYNIAGMAIEMVQETRSVNEDSIPVHKDWKVNDIGKKLADGPALTILDGGPGAGKSFSLGKAMDVMQVPVICLGATESAAAGLYNDMKDAQNNHIKDAKDGKNVPPHDFPILGGLTVDQILSTEELSHKREEKDGKEIVGSSPFEKKEALLKQLNGTPKPCIMVDEAGLLGHEQIEGIMKFAQEHGAKMILAGDSQQIPPEKGQPFKMLAESLKDTPAYVNAPYVFRQGNFVEKAITSGIYHGNDSAEIGVSEKMATEFMIAAYDVGDPKVGLGYKNEKGDEVEFTLADRLNQKYPGKPRDEAVALYVSEMAEKAKTLTPEKLRETAQSRLSSTDGKVDLEAYDTYVCAALACQAMGVRAYEVRDQIKDVKGDIYADVAKDFAKEYAKSLEKGYEKRKDKAKEKGKDTSKLKYEYADGKLAITATEQEAEDLNNAIRKAMKKEGRLQAGEPIILKDGSRVLATKEQAANPPEGFKFAYALDVKTTQGMSQVGKVTFVVRGDTMDKMHGGEILVGATRHKGSFEIKTDPKATENKDKFYKASTQQFAAARIINSAFNKELHEAAGGKTAAKREQEVEKEKKSVMSSLRKINAEQKKEEPKKGKTFSAINDCYHKQQMNNAINNKLNNGKDK